MVPERFCLRNPLCNVRTGRPTLSLSSRSIWGWELECTLGRDPSFSCTTFFGNDENYQYDFEKVSLASPVWNSTPHLQELQSFLQLDSTLLCYATLVEYIMFFQTPY